MESVISKINAKYRKSEVVDVRSGDTVKVHQKIKEGAKERIQIFQGLVIRTDRKDSHTSRITVRRIASGVGVEKSFMLHSPLVVKVEVTKRSKVRRNYLTYMRARTGKSARMTGVDFDKSINDVRDDAAEKAEAAAKELAAKEHEAQAAAKAAEEAAAEAKVAEALKAHEEAAEPAKSE